MVDSIRIFSTRRKLARFLSCSAIASATSWAFRSGFLISITLIGATLRWIRSSSSSRSLSTSAPLGPITSPGRAVLMVIVTSSQVRSIMMSLTAANGGRRFNLPSMYRRTLWSSTRKLPYAALGAYHLLFQSSVIPTRKPVGLTFWPIVVSYFGFWIADFGSSEVTTLPVPNPKSKIENPKSLAPLVHRHHQMTGLLLDRVRLAAVLGLEALDDRAGVDPGALDVQRVSLRGDVLLGRVGDRGADDLLDHA